MTHVKCGPPMLQKVTGGVCPTYVPTEWLWGLCYAVVVSDRQWMPHWFLVAVLPPLEVHQCSFLKCHETSSMTL